MPSCTWQAQTDKQEVFLTFDDGPIPNVTEWVLDVLDDYETKATFFCVGDNIAKHPKIFEKVFEKGHAIGNHTYNHLKGWKTENEAYYANIQKWEETVAALGITLNNKPVFRPPYGQITYSQARHLRSQYEIVMWSIITGDFSKTLNKENCLRKSVQMTEAGSVIVFHDSLKSEENIRYILPRYLEQVQEKGLVFSRMT
jgi:peptidoglycan-N-acetylglucosamine deacetylase